MDPRDQTFITIHNLTPDANILFASDSIADILGYQPDEVRGKSAFEYFHPDEVPFARSIHSRGVLLDKAAVLHYARILAKNGQWVSCECCFTVVHNVLVASTSIYFKGERSERRARDAPQIRRIFSSSPRDPRYHMLEHLSPKFKMPPMEREPRAALILNRFTRNLTIMYATDAVAQILGVQPDELLEKPFYDCIQPNCLDEAERCLESAKANESIAYLRFWYKDPRVDSNDATDGEEDGEEDEDEEVDVDVDVDEVDDGSNRDSGEADVKDPGFKACRMDLDEDGRQIEAPESPRRVGSGPSPDVAHSEQRGAPRQPTRTFELEAVVSCTSDGLVVVLRRARPPIPGAQQPVVPAAFNYENGLFAAPWGHQPIEPYISPDLLYTFRPPLLPQYMPLRECVKAAGGPPLDPAELMRSIRDVAVFAWAVAGINPTLAANNAQGLRPRMGSDGQLPADGPPAWEADSVPATYPPAPDLAADPAKEASTGAPMFGRGGLYGSDRPPFPGYRARHASLDASMYDGSQQQQQQQQQQQRPGWLGAPASPPSHMSSSHGHEHATRASCGHHLRRPQLRPAFSYDALHDHARQQQQQQQQQQQPQQQQQAYPPMSVPDAAAARGCSSFRENIWDVAAAGEAVPPSYGMVGSSSSSVGIGSHGGRGGGGQGDSSWVAGDRRSRYF
ncbi:hypothetical protein VTH06DRAFT_7065 [Thermothelomyces fergusii]